MNYNDYPILNDETYEFLKEKYKDISTFDRTHYLAELVNKLEECKGLCLGIKNINFKLKKCVSDCHIKLSNMLDNLSKIFNIHPTCVEIKEFNIFLLINKVLQCIHTLNFWQQNESKEYYKQTLQNHQSNLINLLLDLTQILFDSNIIMFKHM